MFSVLLQGQLLNDLSSPPRRPSVIPPATQSPQSRNEYGMDTENYGRRILFGGIPPPNLVPHTIISQYDRSSGVLMRPGRIAGGIRSIAPTWRNSLMNSFTNSKASSML
jgi:hypothetical protein